MAMSFSDSGAYLKSISLLKDAVEENDNDLAFLKRMSGKGDETPEIVYLFDTNICEAFFNRQPLNAGSTGFRGLFNPDQADLIDNMWPRLLFEGTLPGQQTSILVSPEHWNEIFDRIDYLTKQTIKDISMPEIAGQVRELAEFAKDPEALVKKAGEMNLSVSLNQLANAVDFGERVVTLFGNRPDGVRRLNALDNWGPWGRVRDKVRYEDYRFWRREIKRYRSRNKQSDNIDNDALTIASIEALYRLAGPTKKSRFIFVTSDRAIISAIVNNFGRLRESGLPNFIRSPNNYMPLVNFRFVHERLYAQHAKDGDGTRSEASEDFIREVETALDVALYRRPGGSKAARSHNDGWKKAKNHWSQAAKLLSYAGARYFAEDVEGPEIARIRKLLKFFETPAALETLTSQLRDTLDHIKEDHARQNTTATLEGLGAEIREGGGINVSEARRAPIRIIDVDPLKRIFDQTDPELARIKSIDQLLDRLAIAGEAQKSFVDKVASSIDKGWRSAKTRTETLLLAACINFSAGRWVSARLCAGLASAGSQNHVLLREARFAEALSLRMTLMSRREFTDAWNLLNANLADGQRDLATERDRMERGALLLTAAVNQAIECATPFERVSEREDPLDIIARDKIPSEFVRGLKDTQNATATIESDFLTATDLETASELYLRGKSNIIGALVASYFLNDLLPVDPDPPIETKIANALHDVETARKDFGRPERALPAVYAATARVIINPTKDNLQALGDIVSKYGDDPGNERKYWTMPDRIEVDFLYKNAKNLVELFG